MGRVSGRRAVKARNRRPQTFLPGNTPWNKGLVAEGGHTDAGVSPTEDGEPTVRGGQTSSTPSTSTIDLKKRLDEKTYSMLHRRGDHILLPCLRKRTKRVDYTEPKRPYTNNKVLGNRIVNMDKLAELVNLFIAGHRKANGRCKGECRFLKNLESKLGLGVKEALSCKACGYKTTATELFQRADTRRPGARGPLAVKLNIQAVTPGVKDRYGPTALKPLFASLDIPDPGRTTMQKKMTEASEVYADLNKAQMEQNCATLAEVKRHRIEAGLSETSTIITESDAAYNNPPKGRSRGQPGTQAECPTFEKETGQDMLLALTTTSQHCKVCENRRRRGLPTGPGSHRNCTQTFDRTKKMGAAEYEMAKKNTEAVLKCSGLAAGTHCTDNDSKNIKGVNDALREAGLPPAEKQDCILHHKRNHRARVFPLDLEVFQGGNATQEDRKQRSRRVGHYIVDRCDTALRRVRKLHRDCDTDFFDEVDRCIRPTLLNCIAGDHSECTYETACPEHSLEQHPAPDIPAGGNLALTKGDRDVLQALVDYRLAPETVKRQKGLMTTNKSESFHKRVTKACPKSMNFPTNYHGRVNAAGLADSIGSGAAIRRANEMMGASHSDGSPGAAGLEAIDREEKYHQDRKKTWKYKNRRYKLGKAKAHAKVTKSGEGYSTDCMHPMVRSDHSYTKN
ncbi:PREDICTED: uncharacterized protein LOC109470151 [Branchiostoma belcheri]|uniref:Uncharacterized protein LOC109470151 n=1 Tax=Branchiostoma belcheri TaxID=7741 RepID=A0A6P4Z4I0_BRABE|nr:PREDICTED: uncharacterized protein LOC109470151 [Branchiostoma belcheri]